MIAAIAPMAHEYVGHWGHGGWWPVFPILGFLFWGLLIFALFRFARRGGCSRGWRSSRSGEAVLGERYAKGEINEEEYYARLGVLRKDER